jgi:hypothetical protein
VGGIIAAILALHHPHTINTLNSLFSRSLGRVIGITPLASLIATTTASATTVTTATTTTTATASTTCFSGGLQTSLTGFLALFFVTRLWAFVGSMRTTTIITRKRRGIN